MIDVNQGVHMFGVNDVESLIRNVKQGFETNKERRTFTKSERSNKLRVRIRLVVAMRLQAQHTSFQLRTSSNTPSVPMNDAQGSFYRFRKGNALSMLQILS
jgi:hypothetical protein